MARRSKSFHILLLFTLLLSVWPRPAAASRPVIKPGREAEIEALFAPHQLGSELTPGWTLHSYSIDMGTIHVFVVGPDSTYAELSLDHPDFGPEGASHNKSFAVAQLQAPPGSEAALTALRTLIETNDTGQFWQVSRAHAEDPPPPPSPDELVSSFRDTFVTTLTRAFATVAPWLRDGLVLLALLSLGLLTLTLHKLRGCPTWMKAALAAIVLVGALLRIFLSPQVALAPWPYTRFLISARLIYAGPLLSMLHPGPTWMSEVITHSTLAFACLAPLAVYVHARYLLDDARAALIAAAIVALLPLHLRFSHSDAAFIPSITVSSLVFTLIHVATRERARALAWSAVLLVGFPLAMMFLVRPLNIMYYPLLVATAFVHQGLHEDKPKVDRPRAGITFALISIVTFAGGVPWLLEDFGPQVSEGLGLDTLASALQVIFSPRMNALLNPRFTPPGLSALALIGAIDLWRRGRRPLFYFLAAWLLVFLVAHAYVVPKSPYMQARYHLHLVVPYMLFAACGVELSLRWLAARAQQGRRYRVAPAALALYLALSPLIHLGSIRETELNDTREWRFVHEMRERIPARCSIIEFTGPNTSPRFERVGAYIEGGMARARWQVHPILAGPDADLPADIRALLEDPPECLYWYEGLPCHGVERSGGGPAAQCEAIVGFVALEAEARVEFESVVYDGNLGHGLEQGTAIALTLYRVSPRPQ